MSLTFALKSDRLLCSHWVFWFWVVFVVRFFGLLPHEYAEFHPL